MFIFILKVKCHHLILDSSHWKFQYTVDYYYYFSRALENKNFFSELKQSKQ